VQKGRPSQAGQRANQLKHQPELDKRLKRKGVNCSQSAYDAEEKLNEAPTLPPPASISMSQRRQGLRTLAGYRNQVVEYSMKLKEDTEARELREITSKQRLDFIKGLKVGDVIGVYCGGTGDVDHTFF
jgi:hypothetical protein